MIRKIQTQGSWRGRRGGGLVKRVLIVPLCDLLGKRGQCGASHGSLQGEKSSEKGEERG